MELEVLSGRARKSRGMWSRRAHELESKINSGDLVQWAEVARDLHRDKGQSDASFSERGLYETATALIAQEIAASRDFSETEAMALILTSLAKSRHEAAKPDIGSDDGANLEKKVA